MKIHKSYQTCKGHLVELASTSWIEHGRYRSTYFIKTGCVSWIAGPDYDIALDFYRQMVVKLSK